MSEAMKLAVLSGRKGFNSGIIEKNKLAFGSTSFKGKISQFLTLIFSKKFSIILISSFERIFLLWATSKTNFQLVR